MKSAEEDLMEVFKLVLRNIIFSGDTKCASEFFVILDKGKKMYRKFIIMNNIAIGFTMAVMMFIGVFLGYSLASHSFGQAFWNCCLVTVQMIVIIAFKAENDKMKEKIQIIEVLDSQTKDVVATFKIMEEKGVK